MALDTLGRYILGITRVFSGGESVAQRNGLDFAAGISVADDAANDRTTITVQGATKAVTSEEISLTQFVHSSTNLQATVTRTGRPLLVIVEGVITETGDANPVEVEFIVYRGGQYWSHPVRVTAAAGESVGVQIVATDTDESTGATLYRLHYRLISGDGASVAAGGMRLTATELFW